MASWQHLLSLPLSPLPNRRLLQGAVYEPVRKEWYLAQARGSTGDAELLLIHRYTGTGSYRDSMMLQWSHGQCFGVRRIAAGAQIWFGQDRWDANRTTRQSIQITRCLYRPWVTERADSGHFYDLPSLPSVGNWARPIFCGNRCHVATRHVNDSDNAENWTRRETPGYLAGADQPLNVIEVPSETPPFQGSATDAEHLYRLYGKGHSTLSKTHLPLLVIKNRWSDGKEVARANMPRMGLLGNENKGYEPEGLTWLNGALVAGVRIGGLEATRQFRLGTVTL